MGEKEKGCVWTERPRDGIREKDVSRGARKWRLRVRGRKREPWFPKASEVRLSSRVPDFREDQAKGGARVSLLVWRPIAVI